MRSRLLSLLLCGLLLLGGVPAWAGLLNGNQTITGTVNAGTATGSANAYVLTLNPAITAYVTNQCFAFKANFTTTGSATVNVNGVGALTIKKYIGTVSTNLAAGDITSGQIVSVCYDGTNMQLVGTGSGALGFTPENTVNKDTSPTLGAGSNISYPSQGAVKTYVNTEVAAAASTTQTLTNKSLSLATNTVTGTLAQLNTAITDGNVVPEARTLTIAGTANEITLSAGTQDLSTDRTWTASLASSLNLATHTLVLPHSVTLPATCIIGQIYTDDDAYAGNNVYVCTATNIWTLQGGYPRYATVDLPATCTAGKIYEVTDALDASCALQHCGTDGQTYSCLVDTQEPLSIPGIFFGASSIDGFKATTTEISTDQILGVQMYIRVTVGTNGLTLTLPAVSDAPVGHYELAIVDAGIGTLTITTTGGELINGTTTPLLVTGQNSLVTIHLFGSSWYAVTTSAFPVLPTLYGFQQLMPNSVKFLASNPAVLDNSETNSRLLFDDTTSQCAVWQLVNPPDYGSAPTFTYIYSMVSAVTGNLGMNISVMYQGAAATVDVNTESFDTANACDSVPVPTTTAGKIKTVTCALTTNDSLAAGGYMKIKACRNTSVSGDATGSAEILGAGYGYTKAQ